MKAAAYARVSSQEQIEGTSLATQESQIRAYAAMRGLEVSAVFVDAGVSGGMPLADRPEGSKLTAMVDRGEVQAIIVAKLDRGFRSASDCLNNVERWEQVGISLHILNIGGQIVDTSTPTGKFFITVMAGAAELERNLIKERCNSGRAARKAENKRIGEVPFGYSLVDDNRLVENPEEQQILGIIRELRAAGQSLRNIADHLNKDGYKAKKNGSWTHSSVSSVLKRAA
jgi:site-specific DNA recombinase